MKRMFAPISAVLAMVLLSSSALAVGPSQSVVSQPAKYATYAAVITGLTPAASATDLFTLTGSSTKTIYVRSLSCTGTSTAAGSLAVTALVRKTADTGGTATNPTAVPMDSTDPAATATVAAYTANPTVGTAVGSVASGLLGTVVAASAGVNGVSFKWSPEDTGKQPTLRGATQVLALNAGGSSFTSGASLTCSVEWVER